MHGLYDVEPDSGVVEGTASDTLIFFAASSVAESEC